MGNYRGRTTLIEDFGSLEHVVEDRGLTKAGFVELIAIQIDTALADVVIADLYPVGLRGIHIAEEVVAGTLEILVLFVAVTVVMPVTDVVSVGENDSIHSADDVLNIGYPFFIVGFQFVLSVTLKWPQVWLANSQPSSLRALAMTVASWISV